MQPDQRDPIRGDGDRKQSENVWVPMVGQRGKGPGVEAGYSLAGVPMSGWESIRKIAGPSP